MRRDMIATHAITLTIFLIVSTLVHESGSLGLFSKKNNGDAKLSNEKKPSKMSAIEESMANARRVAKEIPDSNMEITVIKPASVKEEKFTIAELMKEELSDPVNFKNVIDDYNLGPGASF